MPAPVAARSHFRRLGIIQVNALAGARRAWRKIKPGGNWQDQFDAGVNAQLVALAAAAQVGTTREANSYVPAILDEFAISTAGSSLVPDGLMGWAGDGRSITTLFQGGVVHAAKAYEGLRSLPDPPTTRQAAEEAVRQAEQWVEMTFQTLLADTARAAQSALVAAETEVQGYIRAINPPCCSRCAVLAGRFYRWDAAFARHPRCDCYQIPLQRRDWKAVAQNPHSYFASLSPEDQDKVFTRAGAQAIRDGADITQVVNARRGMAIAQIDGRKMLTTTSGSRSRRAVRLMPESLYAMANGNRERAIELLTEHGFITS